LSISIVAEPIAAAKVSEASAVLLLIIERPKAKVNFLTLKTCH